MKHTKGPWVFNGSEILTKDGNCRVADINPDLSNEHWLGDTQLIAAAPEMLAALETIVNGCLDLSFDQLCLAKDAIRKARGEK
jgi:hypothetical protein